MKISIWTIFGMLGMLATELTTAAKDGKITLREGIAILEKVCQTIGVDLDMTCVELPPPEDM